ncbi:MAG: DUF2812 domain-containing protein [Lachnospiraceae bacterium]|nr:DUF2812 domain-containing protein [Lachnospiraceae bacterium]
MNNIVKARYYAGFIDAQRNWLNKMASKGYRLVKCGRLFYEFETCEPSEYIYQIEYIGDKSKTDGKDYASFLEDMGYKIFFKNVNLDFDIGNVLWRKLADKGSKFADYQTVMERALLIVEKKNDGTPFELHTTNNDKANYYAKFLIPYFMLFLLFTVIGAISLADIKMMLIWYAVALVFLAGFFVNLVRYFRDKKRSGIEE